MRQNYSCKVRNNSPRAPLFLPPGFAGSAGGRGCGCRTSCGGRTLGKAGTADAGVLGRRCSVCGLSAGVRCCAHLRWPTPVRPAPDSRVKGWDFQIFWEVTSRADFVNAARETRSQRSRAPGNWESAPDILEGTPRAGSPMPTGRPSLNARGPAPCLQAVAPTEASSRNSLPALNAAAVVQAMQTVQCVLRKWAVAALGRKNIARADGGK